MKKILSMLIIIMLLMNSSVLMLTSLAVDEENNVSMAEMELSKNQLTNKTQNEIIINGILKRNSQMIFFTKIQQFHLNFQMKLKR